MKDIKLTDYPILTLTRGFTMKWNNFKIFWFHSLNDRLDLHVLSETNTLINLKNIENHCIFLDGL